MSNRLNDPLLAIGKVSAIVLQWLSGLAGGILLLLIPVVILISQGILTGFFEGTEQPLPVMYPVPGVGLFLVLGLICLATSAFFARLRGLIKTVGEGDPFTPENAQRLNMMAWLVLGVQVLGIVVGFLRHYTVTLMSPDADSFPDFDFGRGDVVGILMVIVLLILARVFRHGAAMREDLEGTV